MSWKQKDIAEALGVTEGAVSQWVKRARGVTGQIKAASCGQVKGGQEVGIA
jgi:predicted transcriptional regulator